MKLKLQCTLKLKTDVQVMDVIEDVNIIDLPDHMSDDDIKKFFDNLRDAMKRKHYEKIFEFFDVELKQI